MQCLILGIYALRLGVFLLRREYQQSYRKELDLMQAEPQKIPVVAKLSTWIMAMLYTMMFSHCLFNLDAGSTAKLPSISLVQCAGITLMLFGFSLESIADRQKAARFGDLPEFQTYIRSVPLFFPWVPLYSMKFFDELPFT